MRTIFAIILLVFGSEFSIGQALMNSTLSYNKQQASSIIKEELLKNEFWLMPSDSLGECYFKTKKEARDNAVVKSIPVYSVAMLNDKLSLHPEGGHYYGVLYKGNNAINSIETWVNSNTKKREIAIHGKPKLKVGENYIYASNFGRLVLLGQETHEIWDGYNWKPVKFDTLLTKEKIIDTQTQTAPINNYKYQSESFVIEFGQYKGNIKLASNESAILFEGSNLREGTENIYRNRILLNGVSFFLEFGGGMGSMFDSTETVFLTSYIHGVIFKILDGSASSNDLEFSVKINKDGTVQVLQSKGIIARLEPKSRKEIIIYLSKSIDPILSSQLKLALISYYFDLVLHKI
jgi:hypothetical protein